MRAIKNNLTGQNLGHYRLLERIGRNGMATLYKAHHLSSANCHLALIRSKSSRLSGEPVLQQTFFNKAWTLSYGICPMCHFYRNAKSERRRVP